jgi:hypothetical protein
MGIGYSGRFLFLGFPNFFQDDATKDKVACVLNYYSMKE